MALDYNQRRALRAVGRGLLHGMRFAVNSTIEGFKAVREAGKDSRVSYSSSSSPKTLGYVKPSIVKLPKTRRSGGISGMPKTVREARANQSSSYLSQDVRRKLNQEARQAGKKPRW